MICRNCGAEIADKALICYRCGTATTEAKYRAAPLADSRKTPMQTVWQLLTKMEPTSVKNIHWRYAPSSS